MNYGTVDRIELKFGTGDQIELNLRTVDQIEFRIQSSITSACHLIVIKRSYWIFKHLLSNGSPIRFQSSTTFCLWHVIKFSNNRIKSLWIYYQMIYLFQMKYSVTFWLRNVTNFAWNPQVYHLLFLPSVLSILFVYFRLFFSFYCNAEPWWVLNLQINNTKRVGEINSAFILYKKIHSSNLVRQENRLLRSKSWVQRIDLFFG